MGWSKAIAEAALKRFASESDGERDDSATVWRMHRLANCVGIVIIGKHWR